MGSNLIRSTKLDKIKNLHAEVRSESVGTGFTLYARGDHISCPRVASQPVACSGSGTIAGRRLGTPQVPPMEWSRVPRHLLDVAAGTVKIAMRDASHAPTLTRCSVFRPMWSFAAHADTLEGEREPTPPKRETVDAPDDAQAALGPDLCA